MKQLSTSTYRKRLLLLVAIAAIVLFSLVRTKLGPSWRTWHAQQEMQASTATMGDLDRERLELEARTITLEKRMGTGHDALGGWRTVLDLLAEQGDETNISLAGIAEEHISEQQGLVVHTLPLSLEGRTDELVRMIDAIERHGLGVFLLAVDLQAKETAYNKPRKLTATLYLQTLSK